VKDLMHFAGLQKRQSDSSVGSGAHKILDATERAFKDLSATYILE